jgi:drug/metabolite transporter (DMT)-like permease
MVARASAISLLVVVMCIWGTTYAVTKATIITVPPLVLALLRFLVATIVLLPIAYLRGGLSGMLSPTRILRLALMGLTGVAIYYTSFNLGLTYTTASSAALIQGCMPAVTTMFAATFLHERLTRHLIWGSAISVFGVVMIAVLSPPQANAPHPLLGNLLISATVVAWSAYTVLGRSFRGSSDLAVTAYSTALGTLFLAAIAGPELLRYPVFRLSLHAWFAVLYLGIGATALTFSMWNRALQVLEASLVGNFNNLAPVIGVLTAVLFLGEKVVPMQVLGGVLVLVGVRISSKA